MPYFVQSLFCLLAALILCIPPDSAQAHAVRSQRLDNILLPVVLEFTYSTNDLARYAAIEVFNPGNRTLEYQNGRTDQQGRFSFTPNEAGEWLVVMQDNMGHKLEVPVQVQQFTLADTSTVGAGTATPASQSKTQAAPSTTLNALLGLSLLLNLLTLWYWYKKRRENRAH